MNQPCYINDVLSDDILREIFTYLTAIDNVGTWTHPFYAVRQERAPLLLTYVSSRWRQVAIGARSLWSTLLVAIRPLLVPCGRQELYRMWLDRARGAPVSLEIIDVPTFEEQLLGTADWIGFVLEHIPNLKCLTTGAHVGKAFVHGLLSRPEGSARHLEALRIDLPSENPITSDCYGMLPTLLPNLAQLHLDAECYDGFVDIPTNQFTHLTCSTCFFEALLSTGRNEVVFAQLVELILRVRYNEPLVRQTGPEHKQFIFPEVRIIIITDGKEFSFTHRFLTAIHSPRLEELHIGDRSYSPMPIPPSPPESGDFSFFAQFVSQAPCLRYVVINRADTDFLTTAFLSQPSIREGVDYVHVEFYIESELYNTVADARAAFGEKWEEQGLDIAFKGDSNETITVYVGWSRLPNHPLGRPYRRKWAPAYWN